MIDIIIVGCTDLSSSLDFHMTVIKDSSPNCLVISHIIDLFQRAFLCEMVEQTALIDHPEIGNYPNIDPPLKIFYDKIQYAQYSGNPAPVVKKANKIGCQDSNYGQDYRTNQGKPAGI